MLHPDQVPDVLAVGLPPLAERHVADAPARLHELLPADLGIGLPRQPLVFQKAVDRPPVHRLPADDVYLRLADDLRLGAIPALWLAVGRGLLRRRLVHITLLRSNCRTRPPNESSLR